MVVGEKLDSILGTFVHKGEELFLVVKPDNKTLLASVSQDDVETVLEHVDKQVLVDMKTSGRRNFSAVIEKVAPVASRRLLHLSLAANYGGPLDVKPAPGSEQGLLLFAPRFTVTVQLPDAEKEELRAGQQARVQMKGSSRTPAYIVWKSLKGWFFGRQSQ